LSGPECSALLSSTYGKMGNRTQHR
jgi:hypothetical protein